MYKISIREIALHTPLQQLAMYNPKAFADTLYFETQEQYEEWMATRGR